GTAQGDASRFRQLLVEYNKAPAVTRDRLYLETMQQVLSNTTKVLVDTKSNNNVLFLPFDKLMQQAIAESSAAAQRTAPMSPATPVPDSSSTESRAREASRSREREGR